MEMTKVEISIPPVSVIIAAYNEQAFIEITITSILESGFPCEVIVVDDGSTDQTPQILKKFGGRIRVITHSINKGKGAAMVSGLKEATGEIVIFCDAHLLGLRQHHLLSLVFPLIYGSAKAVLGVNVPEKISPSLNVATFPILTGQRAYYRADLLPLVNEMEDLGYGVETFLFTKFPRDESALVLLPGLVHLAKPKTSSVSAAAVGYLRESLEILETLMRIQGIVPEELTELRQRGSALLAKYTGTRESNNK
jgi:glycosyltransferase involved in cell wall biosynthesis